MHYNNGSFLAVLELAGITEMMCSVQRDYDAKHIMYGVCRHPFSLPAVHRQQGCEQHG